MKLTCATESGRVVQVDVDGSASFEDVKTILAAELDTPVDRLTLGYRGDRSIPDSAVLDDVGVENHDMLEVSVDDDDGAEQARHNSMRQSLSRMTARDIMEQQYIQQEIARKNVQENMALALEESPESFATVLMLYIDSEVNGTPVKTFVDSGAQTTVMSRACAERCGIMRLVDTRFAGVAIGVGSAKIMGRVHLAPIKIGNSVYSCSFTVLDAVQDMELLLGLDMLKKHQCLIDCKNNVLHMGNEEIIPFLSEAEVPDHAKLSQQQPAQ